MAKVLAIIAARGGSKGLPRKNLLRAGGRPLIMWTIEAALQSNSISRVILSSDDDEIIATALEYGCEVPFIRPAGLASDTASSIDVVYHALDRVPGYDYVMLLQPTSPLRTAKDIDAAFALLVKSQAPACVSICPVEESPYLMYRMEAQSRLHGILDLPTGISRRQDLPPVYSLNGAIYIAEVSKFRAGRTFLPVGTVGYVMPRDRSLDIDTEEDFSFFKSIVEKQET